MNSKPTVPAIADEFKQGRGEFYDQGDVHDRSILVRKARTNLSDKSGDFEQSFSDDGGKTWEPNWITTMEREAPRRRRFRPILISTLVSTTLIFESGR